MAPQGTEILNVSVHAGHTQWSTGSMAIVLWCGVNLFHLSGMLLTLKLHVHNIHNKIYMYSTYIPNKSKLFGETMDSLNINKLCKLIIKQTKHSASDFQLTQ